MGDGKEDVQELDEVEKGKTVITKYYMEKNLFSLKEIKNSPKS